MEPTWLSGECNVHGPMISVEGQNRCLKCERAAEKAANPPVAVPVIDPGHEMMARLAANPLAAVRERPPVTVIQPQLVRGNTVDDALAILRSLPMPADIKQFKTIAKVIKQLETLQS